MDVDYGDLDPDDPLHGTDRGYRKFRCRCPKCRAARSAKRVGQLRAKRPSKPPRPIALDWGVWCKGVRLLGTELERRQALAGQFPGVDMGDEITVIADEYHRLIADQWAAYPAPHLDNTPRKNRAQP